MKMILYECKNCKKTFYEADIIEVHRSGYVEAIETIRYYCTDCFAKSNE